MNRGHFVNDHLQIFFLSGCNHFLHDVIGRKIKKVLVNEIMVNAVTNVDIQKTIVVRIKHQSTPTPVGG